MANTAVQPYYTFIKGLATNVSPLASPEGTCSSMKNMTLDQDGSISIRKGLKSIAGPFVVKSGASSGNYFSVAECTNVRGATDSTKRYLAVYTGAGDLTYLDVTSFSAITKLDDETIGFTSEAVSMAAGKGVFLLTGQGSKPLRTQITTGAISTSTLNLKERDFVGVSDGLAINQRPTSLSSSHLYNLLNQGWNYQWLYDVGFPSNADTPWLGVFVDASNDGRETFDATQLDITSLGTSPAAKGRVIRRVFDTGYTEDLVIDAGIESTSYTHGTTTLTLVVPGDLTGSLVISSSFTIADSSYTYWDGAALQTTNANGARTVETISYSSGTGKTTITIDFNIASYVSGFTAGAQGYINNVEVSVYNPSAKVETNYPHCCAMFAGRAWYAGIEPETNSDLTGCVYYTQLLDEVAKFQNCYQQNDPTDREQNEVMATDGGRIVIADAGTVLQMLVLNGTLLLFANNGVWGVTGQDGVFSPTSYSVRKISDRGVQSKHAAVVADGTAMFYSSGNVYAIVQDQITGYLTAKTISDSINAYFETTVGSIQESRVRVGYDKYNKRVYFLMADAVQGSTIPAETHCLVFDLRLGAWYPYTFGTWKDGTSYKAIIGMWCPEYGYDEDTGVIFVGIDYNGTNSRINLFTLTANDDDEHITDGEFSAHATTGHTVLDSAMLKKQMPRVGVYMKRQNNSSLKLQGRFNWSSSGDSGKYSTKQECYLNRGANFDVCYRTLTIRGVGKALQLHFSGTSAAPAKLYGWDVLYSGVRGNDL